MLDPTIGRWINEDPLGFAAGDENLYRYVGNKVTTARDPSGLQVTPVGAPHAVHDGPARWEMANRRSRNRA